MKRNLPHARLNKLSRAIVRQFRVAVVNMDPEGRQGLADWKTCRSIAPSRQIAEAICDIAHSWVICLAAFCIDQKGEQYIKASEIAPQGIYRSDSLAGVLEEHYRALVKSCNPNHLVGSGWIAMPGGTSLDEAQAARIFEACGAWKLELQKAG